MKRTIPVLVLFWALIFLSCKKEDETTPALPQPDSIQVTFTDASAPEKTLTLTDTLRNTLGVKVEVPETSIITKVELYLDGELVGTDSESPYLFNFNTLDKADGTHTLKTVLVDKSGKQVEKTAEIYFLNTLLKLKVQSYLGFTGEGYFIVSDPEGKVLSSFSFLNNTEKEIKLDIPYAKETINLTTIIHFDDFNQVYSYIDIKRGTTWVLGNKDFVKYKDVSFHLKNVPDFNSINISTNLTVKTIKNLQTDTISGMKISSKEGTKVFVELHTDSGDFYDFMEVSGTDMTIDLSSMNKPSETKSVAVGSGRIADYILLGLTDNNGFEDPYWVDPNVPAAPGSLNLRYPSNAFSKYYTYISARETDKTFAASYKGLLPVSFTPIEADATVLSKSIDDFKATFTGDFDSYHLTYKSTETNIGNDWEIHAPKNSPTFILPEIAAYVGVTSLGQSFMKLVSFNLTDNVGYTENDRFYGFYSTYPSTIKPAISTYVSWYYPFSNERKTPGHSLANFDTARLLLEQ